MQRFIRIIAVTAGAWAVLTPLLIFFPGFQAATEAQHLNALAAGRLGEALLPLLGAAVAGLTGELGVRLFLGGWGPGRVLVAGAAVVLLALSVLMATSVGWFLFPPAFLFVFPALWLEQPQIAAARDGLRNDGG